MSTVWLQPGGLLQVVGGGECGSQSSWTESLRDRRNSNRCDSETKGNTDMSKVGGRNDSI